MAKKILKSEIAEDDLFGQIRSSAEETIVIIDKLSKALTETAEAVKKSVGGAKFDSTKAIDNFVKSTKQANDIQKQAIKLEQERAKAVEMRNKAMQAQQKRMQEVEKTEQQSKKTTQESLKIEQEKQKLAQQRIRTSEQQAKADERAAKSAEREARSLKNVAPAYKELSDRSRDLKNQSKELAAQMLRLDAEGKKNSKEFRDLARTYKDVTAQAKLTDDQLKNIDRTVGDNFRNVGNYEGAVNKLRNGLGALGLAFGAGEILTAGVGKIVEFDQSVADLISITGAGGDDLQFFKDQAIELGKSVEGGASSVIEAYKLIGSARPELLENAKSLDAVTQSAIKLSHASGMELPEAATALTDAMNQFGAPAEKAGEFINILANGALFGSAEIPQVTEAMLKFGAVAKSANVSVQESTALIEALASKGLKGAEAGTALRNVMLKLSAPDALPKEAKDRLEELGISFEALSDTSKPFAERLEALKPALKDQAAMVKIFGTENVVAAQNLITMTDSVKGLTKDMDTQGTITTQAEARTKTLSFALNSLKESWNALWLELSSGEGTSKILVDGLMFIADNLGTIVTWVMKAGAAWLLYKTATKSIQAYNFVMSGGLKEVGQRMMDVFKAGKQAADGAKTMANGMKAAGNTMAAIPWMAIIAAVVELSMALYDVASGAAEARRQQDLLNAANAAAEKNLTAAADRYRKQFDEKMRLLDLEIRTRKANGEDEKKLDEEKLKREKEITQATIDRIKKEYKVKTDAMAETIRMEEILRDQIANMGNVMSPEQLANLKEYNAFISRTYGKTYQERVKNGIEDASDYEAVLQKLIARESRLTTEAVGLSEEAKKYGEKLEELTVATKENDYEVRKTIHSTKDKTKAVKEVNTELKQQIDLVAELNKVTADLNETESNIDEYLVSRRAQGLEQQFQDELAMQIEYTKKTGNIDKIYLEELVDARAEILKTAAREQADMDIANLKRQHQLRMFELRKQLEEEYRLKLAQEGITPEQAAKLKSQYEQQTREIDAMELQYEKVLNQQILEINLKTTGEIEDIDREAAEKKKDLNQELLDAQTDYNEQKKKNEEDTNKAIEDAAKKHIQEMKQIADLLTDYLVKQSEKRIAQMEKEIQEATNQRDYYQELAASGNITAKESLAEQNRIIAEANLKKEREERRKQKIELANTVFQTYASKVEGNSKNPLADTIRDISLLNQFVSTLVVPTFKDGTEDTGTHGRGVDGQGGFNAILHPNERVMTKEQNQLVGNMSNEELANLAAEYHAGNVIHKAGATQLGNGWNTAAIIRQLESLEQTIKNKPEHSLGVENVVLGAMDIVKKTKSGNTTTLNRYKVSK